MASAIDPTKPTAVAPTTQSVRDNFIAAKAEIETLQVDVLWLIAHGIAYTTVTAPFTQPAIGTSVTVAVGNSAWILVGALVIVETGGYYRVDSVPGATSADLNNLGSTGNAAPGTLIPTDSICTFGGAQGPTGASCDRGLLADRSAPGVVGRLYYASDTEYIYRDNGTSWEQLTAGALNVLAATLKATNTLSVGLGGAYGYGPGGYQFTVDVAGNVVSQGYFDFTAMGCRIMQETNSSFTSPGNKGEITFGRDGNGNWHFYICVATNTWKRVQVSAGGVTIKRTPVGAGNYTVQEEDYLVCKTNITYGGDYIYLPVDLSTPGRTFVIKDEYGCGYSMPINIVPVSGTIDTGYWFQITKSRGSVTVYCDGSNWWTINVGGQ